ncbi:MAG: LytR/AlgR family response regulator transcription factor [Terriglobales bacterium]
MRVLIVDDEPLARRGVRVCLRHANDVEIVGECATGDEARRQIALCRPDLVFLDVAMPGMDGLQLATGLDREAGPLVIFLTAHDQHALRAFSVHALDYLVKPIHDDRFQIALDAARRRLRERAAAAPGPPPLAVKTGSRTVWVRQADLDWAEASGDYVALHVGPATHLLRQTLDGLERQLDPTRFARIHRSTIVARASVRSCRALPGGDLEIELADGTRLRASRRFRHRLAAQGAAQGAAQAVPDML